MQSENLANLTESQKLQTINLQHFLLSVEQGNLKYVSIIDLHSVKHSSNPLPSSHKPSVCNPLYIVYTTYAETDKGSIAFTVT